MKNMIPCMKHITSETPTTSDSPSFMQGSSRIDPPAAVQRPPRTDRPRPMHGSPASDHLDTVQRPPRTDRPAPMQRQSKSHPPAQLQRPPRSNPPAPVQRPPRPDPPTLMPRPPRSNPPAINQRPPRSNPSAPIQRPPRTDRPAPMQPLPRTDNSAQVQNHTRTEAKVPMQRPPRTKPPGPMHRLPESQSLPSIPKTPRTEPPLILPRPPRTEPPHPMSKPTWTEQRSSIQKPLDTEPPAPIQRPPRTDPPAPMQRPPRSDSLDSMERNIATNSKNGRKINDPKTAEMREVTKDEPTKLSSLGLVQEAVRESDKHLEKANSQPDMGPSSQKNASGDVALPVKDSSGARRSLQLEVSSPKDTQESDGADGDGVLVIPLEEQSTEADDKRKKRRKRKRDGEEEAVPCDLDPNMDQILEDGAKQHNLTAVNVRNIIHEVITNEHVVAMMKAAITETEGLPLFEPKMTRSKLKEVVEKGVVIPTWNLSPIKKAGDAKVPQFVDIPLAEEDSSDEEYQPEEEEEDETAEESLLESDVESTSSSPRGSKQRKVQQPSKPVEKADDVVNCQQVPKVVPVRHVSAEVVPMGPPAPPKTKQYQDSAFMEKLHAVDEELARHIACMDALQALEQSLIACRTRSKRPLKDVPIGQLEAKLQAPDITPDMYDPNTADDDDWKMWLCSLMQDDVGNEDEADDDDDPEYNFLEDLDEPDTEDLRNDRAVRITKKEVNELMEELFETFQDEMGFSHLEDEGPEDEDSNPEAPSNFNTPHAIRFEEPLVNLLNEQHRTVKAQLEIQRTKKSVSKTILEESEEPKLPPPQTSKAVVVQLMDVVQKRRLQQQMQQHVQLLTQMHLLACRNPRLGQEADNARMFLVELSTFAENSNLAHRPLNPDFQSMFQPCNLKEALQLLPAFHSQVPGESETLKSQKKNANEINCLPKHVAWIMATRTVFAYPELLPVCALKPKGLRDRVFFTKAEDNLLALGLKHFEGTEYPKTLIGKYLLTTKTAQQLTVRIKNLTMNKTPDNVIKFYKKTKLLPVMGKCCDDVQQFDVKPPVEREKHRLPFWLKTNLPNIEAEMHKLIKDAEGSDVQNRTIQYPLLIPAGLTLNLKPLPSRYYRKTWRQKRPTILKPLLIRPSSAPSTVQTKNAVKPSISEPVPIGLYKRVSPHTAVPLQNISGVHSLNMPAGRKAPELCVPISSTERGFQIMSVAQPSQITQVPVAQAKMILPALTNQKVRKPPICRVPRRKMAPRMTGFKTTPLMHSTPIIFTVPSGALKLVSLGNSCGMMQPVSSGAGIPVATLLLNPTPFPLNQTFMSPPLSQTMVTGPVAVSDDHLATSDQCNLMPEEQIASGETHKEQKVYFKEEPGALDEECTCIDITIKVEEEEVQDAGGENGSQDQNQDHFGGEDGGPQNEGGETVQGGGDQSAPVEQGQCLAPEDVKGTSSGGEDRVPLYQVDLPQSPKDIKPEIKSECDPSSPQAEQPEIKEELELEKQEMEEHAVSQALPVKEEPVKSEEPGDTEEPQNEANWSQQPTDDGDTEPNMIQSQEAVEPAESPRNTSSSTDGDVDMSSPVGIHHDSSSPQGRQESGNDKDGQEDEEEEDFDDLTQDEEEEEMSSASEESVLSVPELQETMEKLTWLASERRLSQEGDSEENSEPEEEEEEEEGEGLESSSQKEEEMADEVTELTEQAPSHLRIPSPAPVPTTTAPTGERRRGSGKVQNAHRVRSRRGRGRASKDSSKLLLLYDENILLKDPLREQKDTAFAQAYLNRVHEVLHSVPGKYEQFLQLIYQFEMCREQRTAVDLYKSIRELLKDWPQLLKDFAAFLLPEQALECGLFEEQQAFDKSRKFLRQLEICFLENPTHHQKIVKLLQSCAECPQQEIGKLKAQMWQLLKGHDHLQDEFSLFFDQLRPPASRMGDFEVMNWTEDKMYKFDGFEEVTLPDVEEEEEQNKMTPPPRSKKRKEITQGQEKDTDWMDGGKDCPCACHEVAEHRLKRCKRRMCSQCSTKTCETRTHRSRETPEGGAGGSQSASRQGHAGKEMGPFDGRLSVSKCTSSEERLTAGGRALLGNKGTTIQDSNSSILRSRSTTNLKGVTVTESSDCSKQRLPSKDPSRPASRGGRRLATMKVSDPPVGSLDLCSEKQDTTSCLASLSKPSEPCSPHSQSPHKPPQNSPTQSPSSTQLPAEEEVETTAVHVPSCSTSNTTDCLSDSGLLVQDAIYTRTSSNSQPTESSSNKEEQMLTVCAKNITVSSSGEKVILWTREADRVILTMCQERGAQEATFIAVSERLGNKSPEEVSQRFRELIRLFQTSCVASSDEEEEAGSTTEQLSDQDVPLSEEDTED
ncbi:GON-4-like protein [Discoglossus pictus]